MKKLLLSFLICMLAVVGMQAETATLSFADKAQRTEFSSSKQVWEQNGIILTNDKASSSSAVADYAKPARFYASSSITVECTSGKMTQIVFDCNSASYATAMKNSIGTTATVSSDKVTVTFSTPCESFNIAKLTAQVRMDALTVTYEEVTENVNVAEPIFTPASGATFEESLTVTIAVEDGLTAFYSTDNKATYTEGTTFTIAETTTVCAYAQDADGNKSDVVSATYTKVEYVEGVWTLVTDASMLKDGDQIVIAAADSNFALSTAQNTNNRGQAEVLKNGNTIVFEDDTQIITLESGTVSGTWSFKVDKGYLYAASSSSNYLKTQTTKDANASWTVEIDSDGGVATIKAVGENTHNWLRYNNSNKIFSCYLSGQMSVKIYRLEGGSEKETITAGAYYLNPGIWEDNDCALYAIEFVNKNTAKTAWVQGFLSNHFVAFELAEGTYTHMTFHRIKNSTANTAQQITDWTAIETLNKTAELTYTPVADNMIQYYNITATDLNTQVSTGEWLSVVGTGLDRVESINGIGYAYGVVSAEGAIEVYNLNGAVVARGNDNIDLRGLNRGVYIVRNGNQVRKVVR